MGDILAQEKVEQQIDEANLDQPGGDNALHFGDHSKTDLILEVEDMKIYVSKLVLSLASPVFDKMFQSDFKDGKCDVLALPEHRSDDVTEFLRCIYPNTLSPVTRENVAMILPLVEK
jgi:hypothetical protein